MMSSDKSVWQLLNDNNLVDGSAPESAELQSPWYIKVLMAFSGWLASLFLLGFVGMGFEFVMDNTFVMLSIGALLITAAYFLLKQPKNEFTEHLTLAASLAGQALIVFAVFDIVGNKEQVALLIIAIVQIILAIIMPNYIHRFFSAFTAVFCLSLALSSFGFSYIFTGIIMMLCAWIWLNEFQNSKYIKKSHAIGYGVVVALLVQKSTLLFGSANLGLRTSKLSNEFWAQPWIGETICGIALVYVVWQLLQRHGYKFSDHMAVFALLSTVLIGVLSLKAQGLVIGLMILLLGFSASNSVLQGLGVISLIFYISTYYYLLQTSLLIKSQTLFIVGIALLAVRWIFLMLLKNQE